MAYIQKTTPPPNHVMDFSLRSFVGGLNNRSEQLEVNQASDVLNMIFDDDTVMTKRKGQTYYDSVLFSKPVIFMDEYRPYADENVLIRATESEMYIEDKKLTNISGAPSGINHSGRYFFTDGAKLWVYGKFSQTTSTYRKVIGTPVNDYILVEVIDPPADHPKLDKTHVQGVLNIDYTKFEVYYEPCMFEFEDSYKGPNKLPENPKYIVSHNSRIFISGCDKDDDNVFISNIQNPFYFPVSLPIQLPPNSDRVVGLHVYDNSVLVGRHDDLYAIFGNTNRPDLGVDVFQLHKINAHTGFMNHNAINIAHNYLFYFGNDGNAYVLSTTKADEKNLSTSILSKQLDIKKTPINLTLNDLKNASSVFYKDNWYVTIKDKVLVYSYRHKAWTMFNNFNGTSLYVKSDVMLCGRADGRTSHPATDYLDFDKPFEAFWASKRFDMDEANAFKQFREFYIVAHTFDSFKSDINVTFEIDYVDIKDRYTVSNQISIYGKTRWGERFINRNIVESLPFVVGRRGRSIRFKFSNGHFPDPSVDTLADLEHHRKGEGILVYVNAEKSYYLYTDLQWIKRELIDLNQTMKIYQVNGNYELRGKR